MATFWASKQKGNYDTDEGDQQDVAVQAVISIALGLGAFLTFCFLRPRWPGLYAARKIQKNAASRLPELPSTFFGWMPVLYKITEDEVLASAGLDAFVFLTFFNMAIKILTVTFFFSLVVILPVTRHFDLDKDLHPHKNDTDTNNTAFLEPYKPPYLLPTVNFDDGGKSEEGSEKPPTSYLWMYVAFVYLFSGLAIYFIIRTTKQVIGIRQKYLSSQSTITDRTIRLSGIPGELRSEGKIKETIEKLEIGKVESVMLCKDWKDLDALMNKRMNYLRKLEEAWTVHLGKSHASKDLRQTYAPPDQGDGDDEEARLLDDSDNDQSHVTPYSQERPTTRLWYGFLNLQSRQIDAIDYYEEKLRKLDEKIERARNANYKPTPIAFVTLDSIAACQMAVQATMDPEPMVMIANPAPAPSDVVWPNTYLTRSSRMLRSWSITLVILFLTVFWSVLLVPLATIINLENIHKVWPQLAHALKSHEISRSLVQTSLPTLLVSLLNVLVPYLYYWLSTQQGMISQGDVETSVIVKNFIFTFFNLFIVFTALGTTSNAVSQGISDRIGDIGDSLKDTTRIAYLLARSLEKLAKFYINLIVLQGLGLFPFRLLEFGSVALYPIYLMGAKTPRDYAELVQPPVFSYGFYLPQTLLVFIICTVYSVLPKSYQVLFFGLIYFLIGKFIYKYQLLYAMDHNRHSTGRAWPIICICIIIGLIVFQLAMIGVVALQSAIGRSLLILPLLAGTIWFIVYFQRTYEPLMKFIALRSLHEDLSLTAEPGESRYDSETIRGRTVDESEETGLRYINPNLIIPLEEVWLAKKRANGSVNVNREEGLNHA